MKTVHYREAQNLFNESVRKASASHAEKEFPKESVGLVVNQKYIPIKNSSKDPENHFRVHPRSLAKYHGSIQAVIHSHNITVDPKTRMSKHSRWPSKLDQETQIAWDIPFGIQYVTNEGAGNILWWGNQIPIAHYEGRPYIFGVYDCFSIITDYYRGELNIDLPNFPREDEFWKNNENLYLDNIRAYGFEQVSELQKYDVILLTIRSSVPNHAILYLGGDQGLHHLNTNLSSIESINRFIDPQKSLFHSIWRHKTYAKENHSPR